MKNLSLISIIFAAAICGFLANAAWQGKMAASGEDYLLGLSVTVLLALYYLHKLIGWRRSLAFGAITAFIGYGFEFVGVRSPLLFGHYHYADFFSYHLSGVPLIIPIAWFAAVLTSLCVAHLFLPRKTRPVVTILVSSAIAVLYDIPVEYLAKNVTHAWVWEEGGWLFGVPLVNFIGWFLVAAIVLRFSLGAWRDLDRQAPAYQNMRFILFTAYGFTLFHILFNAIL